MQRITKKAKWVKVALTIGEKSEIIKSIDAGLSYTDIAEKYGTCIAQSMVANIRKDVSKVESFNKSMEMGFRKASSKTMKTGKYIKLDKALRIYVHCDCFVLDLWVNNFKIIHWHTLIIND